MGAGRTPHLQHRRWLQPVLAWLVASYIRAVHRSGRWQLSCDAAAAGVVRARRPMIGAFWHGRMMMIDPAWRTLVRELQIADPLRPHVVSSDHRDGRLMARVTTRFGLRTVSGSTKRGAAGLFRAALGVLRDGQIAVVTPDGPRGPRRRAKAGAIRLAMRSGAPIVPITFATNRRVVLRSWDRFVLALPFGRGVLAFGAPVEVGPTDDPEAARLLLERRLNALTDEADRRLGLNLEEPPP